MLFEAFNTGLRAAAEPFVNNTSVNDNGAHWQDRFIGQARVLVGNYKDPITGNPLTVDDVFACSVMWKGINLIACIVAMTSIDLKMQVKNGFEIVTDHPCLRVLDKPTETMSWFEYMETTMLRYYLFGGAYSEKLFDGNTQVGGLSLLDPWNMRLWLLPDGKLQYHYSKWGNVYKFPQERVHALQGPSVDGYNGMAAADFAAKAIMTLRSFDEYALRFFTADAVPPIILKVKGRPDIAEKRTIRDAWEKLHAGITNSRKVGVIGQDIEVEPLQQSNNRDNQLTEQQTMIIQHCARFLMLPNHALNDLTKSAFANISAQSLEMLLYTFAPLFTKIQQRMTLDFLTPAQRKTMKFEFDLNDLRWADPKEQSEQMIKEVQGGIRTSNEARKRIGENPDPDGDHLMFNSAMTPIGLLIDQVVAKIEQTKKQTENADKVLEQQQKQDEESDDDKKEDDSEKQDKKIDDKSEAAYKLLFENAAGRLVNRRVVDLEKAEKHTDFWERVNRFEIEKFEPDMMQAFQPLIEACLLLTGKPFVIGEAMDYFSEVVKLSARACVPGFNKNLETRADYISSWRQNGAEMIVSAAMETVRIYAT